jgi:hypothetical protein
MVIWISGETGKRKSWDGMMREESKEIIFDEQTAKVGVSPFLRVSKVRARIISCNLTTAVIELSALCGICIALGLRAG